MEPSGPVQACNGIALPLPYVTETQGTLTHCGRVTQICVFNTVKLDTSASSP